MVVKIGPAEESGKTGLKKKLTLSPGQVFVIAMLVGVVSCLISWCVTGGQTFSSMFFYDSGDTYMDFYNCLYYARDVFEKGNDTMYPPLAHVIFYFVYCMLPPDLAAEGAKAVRSSQFGIVFMVLLGQVLCAFLAAMVYQLRRGTLAERGLLALSIAVSGPWLFSLERGNLVAITWMFVTLYLAFYSSDDKILREVALVSLAIAAGLKIYPAVLGVLLLREKRRKESGRCIAYGAAAFVLPMLATPKGVIGYIAGILSKYGTASSNLTGAGYSTKVNLSNVIAMTVALFGEYGDAAARAAKLATYLLILLAIIGAVFAEKKWQAMTLLIVAMYSVPAFSSRYVLIYLIVPLVLYLNSADWHNWMDDVCLMLWIAIFIPLSIGTESVFPNLYTTRPVSFLTALEAYASVLLFLFLLVCSLVRALTQENVLAKQKRRILAAGGAVLVAAGTAFTVYSAGKADQKELGVSVVSITGIYEEESSVTHNDEKFKFSWCQKKAVLTLHNKHTTQQTIRVAFNSGEIMTLVPGETVTITCNDRKVETELTKKGQEIAANFVIPAGNSKIEITSSAARVRVDPEQDKRQLYFTVSDLTITDLRTGSSVQPLHVEEEEEIEEAEESEEI